MFKNKLVAVLNKSIEPGQAMNALSHISLSLGAKLGKKTLQLVDYQDKDGQIYPDISKMPFIVLRTNSNKIRNLYNTAKEGHWHFSVFTDTMTVGSWDEQVAKTKEAKHDDLDFWGIVLCGPWDAVSESTKKFSLWK